MHCSRLGKFHSVSMWPKVDIEPTRIWIAQWVDRTNTINSQYARYWHTITVRIPLFLIAFIFRGKWNEIWITVRKIECERTQRTRERKKWIDCNTADSSLTFIFKFTNTHKRTQYFLIDCVTFLFLLFFFRPFLFASSVSRLVDRWQSLNPNKIICRVLNSIFMSVKDWTLIYHIHRTPQFVISIEPFFSVDFFFIRCSCCCCCCCASIYFAEHSLFNFCSLYLSYFVWVVNSFRWSFEYIYFYSVATHTHHTLYTDGKILTGKSRSRLPHTELSAN